MSNYSSDNEVVGTTVLTGAVIAISVAVLIAFLAGTLPHVGGANPSTNAPAQNVVDTTTSQVGQAS